MPSRSMVATRYGLLVVLGEQNVIGAAVYPKDAGIKLILDKHAAHIMIAKDA